MNIDKLEIISINNISEKAQKELADVMASGEDDYNKYFHEYFE
jgi:hypothetical protein